MAAVMKPAKPAAQASLLKFFKRREAEPADNTDGPQPRTAVPQGFVQQPACSRPDPGTAQIYLSSHSKSPSERCQEAGPSPCCDISRKESGAQQYDFFLVYDFEATCASSRDADLQPQELIEFACCVVDVERREVVGEFQEYVRPTEHPTLTPFCTALTGITQAMVDGGAPLGAVLARHGTWLEARGFLRRAVPVTWSDWDLKVQLEREATWRELTVPQFLRRWVDLRAAYARTIGKPQGLRGSVEAAGLRWEGHAHSGLDDARNTARLALRLCQAGTVLAITGSFTGEENGKLRQSKLLPDRPLKRRRVVNERGEWNGLCECGVKAKLCIVKRPGPNNGRQFWGCGTWTILRGRGLCNFLTWVDAVVPEKVVAR